MMTVPRQEFLRLQHLLTISWMKTKNTGINMVPTITDTSIPPR